MGDLGKLIVAKGFKKFPKVQKIARSGHTAHRMQHAPINRYNKMKAIEVVLATKLFFKMKNQMSDHSQ